MLQKWLRSQSDDQKILSALEKQHPCVCKGDVSYEMDLPPTKRSQNVSTATGSTVFLVCEVTPTLKNKSGFSWKLSLISETYWITEETRNQRKLTFLLKSKEKITFVLSQAACSKQVTGFDGLLPNSYLCFRSCSVISIPKTLCFTIHLEAIEAPISCVHLFNHHQLSQSAPNNCTLNKVDPSVQKALSNLTKVPVNGLEKMQHKNGQKA